MIIITGGAGFIGSVLISKLNNEGITDIIIVDNFERNPDKWKNLNGLIFSDCIDKNEFINLMENTPNISFNISTIIHLGACTDTTNQDIQYIIENNFRYSKRLLDYSCLKNIDFIYASSAATYGKFPYLENEPLRQLNPYAFSKHIFDTYATKLRKSHQEDIKCNITGLKFFNVYGPNEYHKGRMKSFINHAYHQIKDRGYVELFKSNDPKIKDGNQSRDFIYVEDVADLILFFMKNNYPGLYDIGTGINTKWNDVILSIFSSLKKKVDIRYIDIPIDLNSQYQNYTKANIEELIKVLNSHYGLNDEYKQFHKFLSIKEGIKKYVKFLEEDKYFSEGAY